MKARADLSKLCAMMHELDREGVRPSSDAANVLQAAIEEIEESRKPIPMILWCPACSSRHTDEGEFATKPHHTHACQSCGMVWRPAIVPTVGVRFLPGFKNKDAAP